MARNLGHILEEDMECFVGALPRRDENSAQVIRIYQTYYFSSICVFRVELLPLLTTFTDELLSSGLDLLLANRSQWDIRDPCLYKRYDLLQHQGLVTYVSPKRPDSRS